MYFSLRIFIAYLLIMPLALLAETSYKSCTDNIQSPIKILSSGWSKDLQQQRFYTQEDVDLNAEDLPSLEIAWSFVFKNTKRPRSLPAISTQAVFLGSEEGRVFALNIDSGCGYWHFQADAEVRTAISLGQVTINDKKRDLVFFADLKANAYAVDALTGELIWKRHLDKHPDAVVTGSPVFYQGQLLVPLSSMEVKTAVNPLYNCCSFRGSLASLNAINGDLQWRFYTIKEASKPTKRNILAVQQYGPSGVAIWSAPTIDEKRQRIYIGTGQNYSSPATTASDSITAIDLHTGKQLWSQQFLANDAWNASCTVKLISANCPEENGSDSDFGAPPILVTRSDGKDVIIAGQKNGYVYAMDVDNEGKELWRRHLGRGGLLGGVHWGIAANSEHVYVPVSDVDIFPAPSPEGPKKPGLTKLDIVTGKTIWASNAFELCDNKTDCRMGLSAAITGITGAIIAPALDGIVSAYDEKNGKIIWQFDSTQKTLGSNGLKGAGGTIDAGGVVIADGRMFMNSGYGGFTSMGSQSGNVFWVLKKQSSNK